MADKEATVYIIDVGKSMGECRNGRSISDLDWVMKYVWDRITTTVATGRKTSTIGVVGLRTDGTKNELAEGDDSYDHISIFQPIGQLLMPDLRKLRELIKPSKTDKGDAISSLVIAIDMINNYTKKLKYKRRIVLVTNGLGSMNTDGLEHIISKIKEDNIELLVLGTDFDDPEFGFKEEDKDPKKAKNEALLRELVEDCDGVYGTVAQAISEMDIPRVKTVRGVSTFKGELRLGNPEQYETAFRIPVERYYRTYVAKPPTASSFVVRSVATDNQETAQSSATVAEVSRAEIDQNLTLVRHNRSYYVQDDTVENGQREISRDDLARGYEYGRTAVHISESDENITTLETYPVMEIIGFIQSENYKRYMNMSTCNVIIAQKTNDEAGLALSSLIHALFELECYAVARLVTKERRPPLVVLLVPSIEPDFECLLEVQLPFAEDVRPYRFPPLDRVITVSGKTVTEHRNLPKEDLMNAMSDYVDSMELDRDGSGEPIDGIPMEDTYSPLLHRIEQAIRYRAINPEEPLPAPSERLTQLSKPPEELQERAKKHLERLTKIADVKKVPPKAQTRKRAREADKPLSGLNVDELLQREKRVKISPQNAIPEFKQTVANAANIEAIKDAADQMEKIIEDHIRNSFGDANYDRVVEELGVVRDEMIAYEEPGVYNAMIRRMKEKILAEKLGGDRKELWWLIRRAKVGLIHRGLSEKSDVTEDEAKAFSSSK